MQDDRGRQQVVIVRSELQRGAVEQRVQRDAQKGESDGQRVRSRDRPVHIVFE